MAGWGALAASALLLLCAIATGTAVLRVLRATPHPAEQVLYALAAGLVVQGSLLLASSAVGWMHPAALWSAVLLPALPGLRGLRVLPAALRSAREALATVTAIERLALLGVVGAVCCVLFVGAMVPVTDWDSQMYHLRIPKQLLEAGRLVLPADGNHLAFLGLFQFLYLPLLAIGAESGPALLNAAMTLALGATLAVAGRTLFSVRTGVLAAIAVWGSASLLLVGVTPRVDVALAAALAITHLAVLRAFDDDAPWALSVAALCAGLVFAMKYHALPYTAALAPLALVAAWRRHRAPAATAREAAVALGLAAVVVAPWLAKNIVFFGAPLFPFFAAQRLVPFLAEITGSFAIPPEVPAEALRAVGKAREPVSLAALLFRPAALSVELEAQAYTRNALFALLPLALLYIRDRRILLLALPGLAYLGFTLGWFNHTNPRYFLPALPMLALCAVESAHRFATRLLPGRRLAPGLAVLAVLAAAPGVRSAWERVVNAQKASVAIGLWDREGLLQQDAAYAAARLTAERTPPDARILMLFEARGYYFERDVLQDNLLTNWVILDRIGATERCLAGTGITHVLLNSQTPSYYRSRGVDLAQLGWDRFPAFTSRCLDLVGTTRGQVLFRVRDTAP
jgi:hypothetical protein